MPIFLNKCKVYVSKNPDIDLAYIETNETAKFNIAQGHVLEDVLVMGYPKVSFFLISVQEKKLPFHLKSNLE